MKCVKCVIFMFLAKTVCYGDAREDYIKACKLVSALDLNSESLCQQAEECKITNKVTFFMQIQFCGLGARRRDRKLFYTCKERFDEVGQQLPKAKKLLKAFEEVFCDHSHLLNYYAMKNHRIDILGALCFILSVKRIHPESKTFSTIYEIYNTCLDKYDATQ